MERPHPRGGLTAVALQALLAGEPARGRGVAIVVAHPDDETLCLGGHLASLPAALMVHVTDGAPRDGVHALRQGFERWQLYAAARRRELSAALRLANFPEDRARQLNYPDQQAARYAAELAQGLAGLFDGEDILFAFTHAYEGGHPDHDATALAVQAACALMRRHGREPPMIIEMPLYRLGEDGPAWQNFASDTTSPSFEVEVRGEALQRKRQMLACHQTQSGMIGEFDPRFERFRAAPGHDFSVLPNDGKLLYESWELGMKGGEWLSLAEAALRELELGPSPC